MADYVLTCCSTCDLTPVHLDRLGIRYVYFNYELDGEQCKDDFGRTHTQHELYRRMRAGATVRTSQVSVGEYLDLWRSLLKAGKDVLHVALSSGISGTYGSACTARDAIRQEFPERRIEVIDSLCASSGLGLLLDTLAGLRNDGMSMDRLVAWAEAHKAEVNHWFFSSDLTFFVRGGRISRAAGAMGGLLRICPVMEMDDEGALQVREKVRTKLRAQRRMVRKMHELAQGGDGYARKVFISHSDCLRDARGVGDRLEREFPHLDGHVHYFDIGTTIGCHTGPGTVALFFWGTRR